MLIGAASPRVSVSTRSRIRISVSSSGMSTPTWNRNRSSWASGSGKVPSCSSGFCVAITRNPGDRGRVWPPAVTCRSPIASRSADCTFGGARLISSTSRSVLKTGPGRNSIRRSLGWKTWVPVMSAGMRSGVHWIRAKLPASPDDRRRTARVLASPGAPSIRTCPPARSAIIRRSTSCARPIRPASISDMSRRAGSARRASPASMCSAVSDPPIIAPPLRSPPDSLICRDEACQPDRKAPPFG